MFRLLWKEVSLKCLNVNQALIPNSGFQDGMGVHQRVGVVQIRLLWRRMERNSGLLPAAPGGTMLALPAVPKQLNLAMIFGEGSSYSEHQENGNFSKSVIISLDLSQKFWNLVQLGFAYFAPCPEHKKLKFPDA